MINANKLRGAIVEAGYNQRTLAAKIGCSETTLTNKLNGKTDFTLGEVDRICEVLNINDPSVKCEIFLP